MRESVSGSECFHRKLTKLIQLRTKTKRFQLNTDNILHICIVLLFNISIETKITVYIFSISIHRPIGSVFSGISVSDPGLNIFSVQRCKFLSSRTNTVKITIFQELNLSDAMFQKILFEC